MRSQIYHLLASPLLLLLLLLVVAAVAAKDDNGGGAVRLWCVAKNNADEAALQKALDWACDPSGGGVDCGAIQEGGACFYPDVVHFHASYAFNEYYSRRPSEDGSCNFDGTATVTQLNPAESISGVKPGCKFPATLSGSGIGLGPSGSPSNGIGRFLPDCSWAISSTILCLLASWLW